MDLRELQRAIARVRERCAEWEFSIPPDALILPELFHIEGNTSDGFRVRIARCANQEALRPNPTMYLFVSDQDGVEAIKEDNKQSSQPAHYEAVEALLLQTVGPALKANADRRTREIEQKKLKETEARRRFFS